MLSKYSLACTEVIVVKEVITPFGRQKLQPIAFFVVYLAIKHMALTSLTSLNSLTSTFAKVEYIILGQNIYIGDLCLLYKA